MEVDQEITYQTIDTKAASLFDTGSAFYSWAYLLAEGSNWDANYASSKPYITNSLIKFGPGRSFHLIFAKKPGMGFKSYFVRYPLRA